MKCLIYEILTFEPQNEEINVKKIVAIKVGTYAVAKRKNEILSSPETLNVIDAMEFDTKTLQRKDPEISHKEDVWNVNHDMRLPTEVEAEYVNMAEFVPICQVTLSELKLATETDAEVELLIAVIKQGWPEHLEAVSLSLHGYFSFREELSVQNGVVFKGERILVPLSLRQCIIDKIHASHLGVQGCLRRAKEAFYWPGM